MNLKRSLQTTFWGPIVAVLSAISCNILNHDFNNPLDPENNRIYGFRPEPHFFNVDTVPILTDYTVTCEDTCTANRYWKFNAIAEPNTADCEITIDSSVQFFYKISTFFKEPFEGKLIVQAIKPNREVDSISKIINIINPYIISGNSIQGVNEKAQFTIVRNDFKELDNPSLNVLWKIDSMESTTKLITEPFDITMNSITTITLQATIIRNTIKIPLPPRTISFRGHTPVIDSASFLDTIFLGEKPRIFITWSDKDTADSISLSVFSNGSMVEGIFEIGSTKSSGIFSFHNSINDTLNRIITIVVSDNTALSSKPDTLGLLPVKYTLPVIKFNSGAADTLRPPVGEQLTLEPFVISGEPAVYKWYIDGKDTITYEPLLILNDTLRDTVITHSATVQGIDRFNIAGPTDTLFFRAAPYRYRIAMVGEKPLQRVKIKQQLTWKVKVVENQTILGNDSISYIWSGFDSSKCVYNQTGSELKLNFPDSVAAFTLSVFALVGTEKVKTPPLSFNIATFRCAPTCKFSKPEGKEHHVYINDSITFAVHAHDTLDGTIEEVFYKVIQGTVAQTIPIGKDTTFSRVFRKKGTYQLAVYARDNDSVFSKADTITIIAESQKPQFLHDTLNVAQYIKDSIYVHAPVDSRYSLTYIWDRNNDGIFEHSTGNADSLLCSFTEPGNYSIRAQCISEMGDSAVSELLIRFLVKEGKPIVKKITLADTTYPGKKFSITIDADDNGSVREFLISFDSSTFVSKPTSIFDTALITYGYNNIWVKVQDDIGLYSLVLKDSIFVAHGEPVIKDASIAFSTYIKDPITLSFKLFDPNGSVQTVFVSWNGDTVADTTVPVAYIPNFSYSIIKKFSIAEAGEHKVLLWAIDNDNEKTIAPTELEIEVLKGEPYIQDIIPHEVWVNDTNQFRISARDPNDTVTTWWIDWSNNGTFSSQGTDILGPIPGSFDTTNGDQFARFKVQIADKDGNVVSKACSVSVKMGRPVVSAGATYGNNKIHWNMGQNGAYDTMVYAWNSSPDTPLIDIAIAASDPNDSIIKYYWAWDAEKRFLDSTDIPYLTNKYIVPFSGRLLTATCIDQNKLRSKSYTFVVYPDEPPTMIEEVTQFNNANSVSIFWKGGIDPQEGDTTKIKILMKQGAQPAKNDIAIVMKLNEYQNSTLMGYDKMWTFTGGVSGTPYYYSVVVFDKSGLSKSKSGSFVFP